MKLFVWDGVFVDYTSGIAFALATDVDEARSLVVSAYIDRYGRWSGLKWHEHLRRVVMDELSGEPRVYETLHGEFLEGGG